MKKLAIVTGGAGFIGSHLVDALVAKKWKVEVIDNLSSGRRLNVHPKAKLHVMDVRSLDVSRLIYKLKPHAIFHVAAQISVPESIKDPIKDAEVNIHAAINLLEAASKVGVMHFIYAGTGGPLSSEKTKLPTDEAHAGQPESPYGISKMTVELYGNFYRKIKKVPFTGLRFANVYGPRQSPHGEAGVVSVFTRRMLSGMPVQINGSGKQTRDYVYVQDIVKAFILALKNPDKIGPYHVGTGIETDVCTLFSMLSRLTRYNEKPLAGPADIGAPLRSVLDAGKIRREFGWKPSVTLDQGLKKTVAWFKNELKKGRI